MHIILPDLIKLMTATKWLLDLLEMIAKLPSGCSLQYDIRKKNTKENVDLDILSLKTKDRIIKDLMPLSKLLPN